MPNFAKLLKADKSESTLLVLYIPSADRKGKSLGKKTQSSWVRKALQLLGLHMGGGTAFPRGLGVWRDDAQGGKLVWDKPVLIQCYTNEEKLVETSGLFREFLEEMGKETNQGAVGFVIDQDYFEIRFPLEGN